MLTARDIGRKVLQVVEQFCGARVEQIAMSLVLANNPNHPLSNPLPCVSRLLGNGDPHQAIRDSIEQLRDTVQGELLAKHSAEVILRYTAADVYPLPATQDREGYFGDDHLCYWTTGFGDYLFLKGLAPGSYTPGSILDHTILDLGCASGRVLRHFAVNEQIPKLYGADINRNYIAFIRRYLPDKLLVFQNTIVPPLPLPDNSIDFVYGLSVFTHIHDFEEAWLLEVKRVLKPNGSAFITFHSDRTWESIRPGHFLYEYFIAKPHGVEFLNQNSTDFDQHIFEDSMPDEKIVFVMKDDPFNNTNVFCTRDYIRRMWGRFLTVTEFYSRVHGPHQDGVVLKKP